MISELHNYILLFNIYEFRCILSRREKSFIRNKTRDLGKYKINKIKN